MAHIPQTTFPWFFDFRGRKIHSRSLKYSGMFFIQCQTASEERDPLSIPRASPAEPPLPRYSLLFILEAIFVLMFLFVLKLNPVSIMLEAWLLFRQPISEEAVFFFFSRPNHWTKTSVFHHHIYWENMSMFPENKMLKTQLYRYIFKEVGLLIHNTVITSIFRNIFANTASLNCMKRAIFIFHHQCSWRCRKKTQCTLAAAVSILQSDRQPCAQIGMQPTSFVTLGDVED